MACIEGLAPSLYHHWEEMEALISMTYLYEVKSLGACPCEGYWDSSPLLSFLTVKESFPAITHYVATTQTTTSQNRQSL